MTLLKANKDVSEIQKVFQLCYDWKRTYGIRLYDVEPRGKTVSKKRWRRFRRILGLLRYRVITGNKAKKIVEKFFRSCSELEAKWYDRIIQRDLRIGIAATSVSRIWPDLLPTWGVQLAETLMNHLTHLEYPIAVEPKLDGIRMTFVLDGKGRGVGRTRKAYEYDQYEFIVEALRKLPGSAGKVFDGELRADSWNSTSLPKKPIELLSKKAREKLFSQKFYIFDVLDSELFDEGECRVPMLCRRDTLQQMMEHNESDVVQILPQTVVDNEEQLFTFFDNALKEGYEGIMVKRLTGWYTPGARNSDWLKFKPTETREGKLVKLLPGKGRNEGRLGSFLVRLEDGREARVGTGFTDSQRKRFWKRRKSLKGKTVEFVVQKEEIEVAVIRHGRFKCFREDK